MLSLMLTILWATAVICIARSHSAFRADIITWKVISVLLMNLLISSQVFSHGHAYNMWHLANMVIVE